MKNGTLVSISSQGHPDEHGKHEDFLQIKQSQWFYCTPKRRNLMTYNDQGHVVELFRSIQTAGTVMVTSRAFDAIFIHQNICSLIRFWIAAIETEWIMKQFHFNSSVFTDFIVSRKSQKALLLSKYRCLIQEYQWNIKRLIKARTSFNRPDFLSFLISLLCKLSIPNWFRGQAFLWSYEIEPRNY